MLFRSGVDKQAVEMVVMVDKQLVEVAVIDMKVVELVVGRLVVVVVEFDMLIAELVMAVELCVVVEVADTVFVELMDSVDTLVVLDVHYASLDFVLTKSCHDLLDVTDAHSIVVEMLMIVLDNVED